MALSDLTLAAGDRRISRFLPALPGFGIRGLP